MSRYDGSPSVCPLAIIASGVALVVASGSISNALGTAQLVIVPENAVIRIILAVAAGLAKFCPIPPKSCFTTTIAITLPSAACQSGIVTGRLSAKIMPVTTAERSSTVLSFLQSF